MVSVPSFQARKGNESTWHVSSRIRSVSACNWLTGACKPACWTPERRFPTPPRRERAGQRPCPPPALHNEHYGAGKQPSPWPFSLTPHVPRLPLLIMDGGSLSELVHGGFRCRSRDSVTDIHAVSLISCNSYNHAETEEGSDEGHPTARSGHRGLGAEGCSEGPVDRRVPGRCVGLG